MVLREWRLTEGWLASVLHTRADMFSTKWDHDQMDDLYARFQKHMDRLNEGFQRALDELTMCWGHIKEKRDRLYEFFCAIAEGAKARADELFGKFSLEDRQHIRRVFAANELNYAVVAAQA